VRNSILYTTYHYFSRKNAIYIFLIFDYLSYQFWLYLLLYKDYGLIMISILMQMICKSLIF
jgi:hypothetical protein